ncbi:MULTISPECIES: Hsp70 family protein [Streptomyces]|uniref:Hsp70 family protein n=1 Tax=Streptomyces koelreuteriae TaxID=2838015 RepID=A0ABX8G3N0_9ACTN|nr:MULTISPECIES: Hsp70 family protein [Streptomyces]QWB27750.1 Hsp70 family protein [Streptomyces koelreuteriae]UUA10850.1 Hsp70 family protein [Streptomyces koelreuteriae]UUA18456.1 Hsp70 family protein [Streptomyces sp. CRCS-T-1]
MAHEPVLAIDFGTSTSAVALLADGRVRMVKEPSGDSWAWPSAVSWDGSRLLVGTPAEHRKAMYPSSFRGEFKRNLGESAPLVLGDASYQAEQLVTALISAMRGEAERLYGRPITRAVLTCPASYGPGDPRRGLLIGAGEAAGLTAVDLLPEPVAAAFAPLAGAAFEPGRLVLVYDFGGGTFDAALIRTTEQDDAEGTVEVLGHAALDDCGGHDIDVLLAEELVRRGGAALSSWLRPGPEQDDEKGGAKASGRSAAKSSGPTANAEDGLRRTLDLGDFAHRFKHRLSVEAEIEDFFRSAGLPVGLDRARLAELTAPLVTRTVACCRDLLDRCGRSADRLAAVLLVGGTTRMPAVRDALEQAFPGLLRGVEDPELAVAQGAAAWAGTATERYSVAGRPAGLSVPLSWELPGGGTGKLLQWYVGPGDDYPADAVFALVRLTDGGLWELRADGRPGRVAQLHSEAGSDISSGDWLVTTGRDEPAGRGRRRGTRAGALPSWEDLAPPPSTALPIGDGATAYGRVLLVPGGRHVVTQHGQGTVGWELNPDGLKPLWELPSVFRVVSAGCSGTLLAVVPVEGTGHAQRVDVVDVVSGEVRGSVPFDGACLTAAFSSDGTRLAVLSNQRRLRIFALAGGDVLTEADLSRYSMTGEQLVLDPALEFAAFPVGNSVIICHVQGRQLAQPPHLTVNDPRKLLALPSTAGFASGSSVPQAVDVWSLDGHAFRLHDPALVKPHLLAVSADERLLAAADPGGLVAVWELPHPATADEVREVPRSAQRMLFPMPVRDLAFGADATTLIAATDREIHVWDL